MKTRKPVKILSVILLLVLMSTIMTGYASANEIEKTSNTMIPCTVTGDSFSADGRIITVSSAKTSIKNGTVTGVTDRIWTGKEIKPSPDYRITYFNNKNVGTAKVIIQGKGKYTGSLTKAFYIKPKGTTITYLKRNGPRMTLGWKKVSNQVSGYQIAYSGARYFKAKLSRATKIEIENRNTVSKTIAIYASCLRYKLWIRSFKKIGNKKYYSNWSNPVSIWRNGKIEPY